MEDTPLMRSIRNIRVPEHVSSAKRAHHLLVERIKDFERRLEESEEMSIQFATFPVPLRLRTIGNVGEDTVFFCGEDADDRYVEIFQHHSQVSFALIATPAVGPDGPRRIGFDIAVSE